MDNETNNKSSTLIKILVHYIRWEKDPSPLPTLQTPHRNGLAVAHSPHQYKANDASLKSLSF